MNTIENPQLTHYFQDGGRTFLVAENVPGFDMSDPLSIYHGLKRHRREREYNVYVRETLPDQKSTTTSFLGANNFEGPGQAFYAAQQTLIKGASK